jgi:hypothetical protein
MIKKNYSINDLKAATNAPVLYFMNQLDNNSIKEEKKINLNL